jgi:predicted Zn-dependent peptidase
MQLILDLEQSKDEMSHLGKIAYYQSIFPSTHPYYEIGIEEQIQIVKAANQKELIDFHKTYYKPERLILAISGDFEEKEIINSIKKHFAAFGDSIKASNNKANTYNVPVISLNEAGKTKEIQVPGKSQAVVMLGHAGQINRTHPDFYALLLANDILGGGSSLSSRLGKRVREEAGLVYYIGSSFNMGRGVGPFTVKMGVAPNKIDEAVKLTKEEIEKFQKGDISDEEFEKSKSYLSGAFISHNLTSNESVASSLRLYEMWGLDLNTINEYPNKIKALKKEDVIKAAQKYIHPDKLQMVIVKPK